MITKKYFMFVPVSLAAASAALLTLSGCARQNPGLKPKAAVKAPGSKDGATVGDKKSPDSLSATTSSDEQIDAAIKDAKREVKNSYTRLGAAIRSGDKIQEDVLAALLESYKGTKAKSEQLMKFIEGSSFSVSLKKDDSCTDNTAKTTGQICFNSSELRKTAPENLRAFVVALAARQISTIYGQDDATAAKVQRFFIENRKLVSPTDEVLSKLSKFREESIDSLRKAASAVAKSGPDEAICPSLLNMNSSIDNVLKLTKEEGKLALPGSITKALGDARLAASKALGFCGEGSASIKGDRIALIDLLANFGDQQIKSASYLAKFVNSESPTLYHSVDDASMLLTLGAYKGLIDQKAPSRTKQAPSEKEIGCRISSILNGNETSAAGNPAKTSTSNATQVIYSFSRVLPSTGGNENIEVIALLRDRALPGDLRSGLELRLEVRKNGEIINKDIRIAGQSRGLVAVNAERGIKVPMSMLRRGERDAFQFLITADRHDITVRCELLKDAKQSPESVKISRDWNELATDLESTTVTVNEDSEEAKLVDEIKNGKK